MRVNRRRIEISWGGTRSSRPPRGFLGKVLSFALGAVLLVGAFVFSLVLFAVLLCVGLIAGIYLWWRTRGLRRQARAQAGEAPRGVEVIEGEFTRESKGDGEADR